MGEVEHAGQREVDLGDGEVFRRFVELDGAGRSLEVNEEAGRAKFVSTTDDVRVGGKRTGKHSPQTLHDGTQIFF